ncbi:MAG: type II toxin-antitoxin system HicA family toxin [Desulfohalobiaceae bacterium]|nr:type II toxin-antitoxin system HicA family toxin [Desulfohalobiaceae bacterium]
MRQAGCSFERQGKGDHEIWFSPITGIRFVVDN